MIAIPVAMLALLVADTAVMSCGDQGRAEAALARKLAVFQPGVKFDDLRQKVGNPSFADDSRAAPPRRDIPWLVVGEDGSRSVLQNIACDFDEADHLIACRHESRFDVQVVTLAAWETVPQGASESEVIRRLCEPEQRSRSSGGELWNYMVTMPPEHAIDMCAGTVRMSKRKVAKRSLRCL